MKNSSGEDVREHVYVSPGEVHELSGSRGTANFRLKWVRDSKHEAYLNVQQVKGVTRALTAADEGQFVPIAGFDCRGLDPIDWRPEVRCDSGGCSPPPPSLSLFLLEQLRGPAAPSSPRLGSRAVPLSVCRASRSRRCVHRRFVALQGGFVVKSAGGKTWEDVDLGDKEWADYDERKGESVSIMDLEWEFRVHKEKK